MTIGEVSLKIRGEAWNPYINNFRNLIRRAHESNTLHILEVFLRKEDQITN
jgi:hypothetical protein